MEKKLSPENLHKDGLLMIEVEIRQAPVDGSRKRLDGQAAIDCKVIGLKQIMGYRLRKPEKLWWEKRGHI